MPISKKLLFTVVIGTLLGLACVFAYQAPFSSRSMVGNLDPYPDTLFYTVPTWNFVNGDGWQMKHSHLTEKSIVPPVYGWWLIPFLGIFEDVRGFYFANIVSWAITVTLFVLLIRKIIVDDTKFLVLALGIGFLFVTQFYFFRLPRLAMAENITLVWLMTGLIGLVGKIKSNNIFLVSVSMLLLLLTKFSNLPIAVALHLCLIGKIVYFRSWKLAQPWLLSVVSTGLIFGMYLVGSSVLEDHKNLDSGTTFSLRSWWPNAREYLAALFGQPLSFLWWHRPLATFSVFLLTYAALALGIVTRQWKWLLFLLIWVVTAVAGMSLFYFVDGRYILYLVPVTLVVVVALLQKLKPKYLFLTVLFAIFVHLGWSINDQPYWQELKTQLAINFKYQEMPWNWIAAQVILSTVPQSGEIITYIDPYYFHLVGSKKVVTITPEQAMQQLDSGEDFDQYYLSNYYHQINPRFSTLIEKLNEVYHLEKMNQEDCHGNCIIWKIKVKQ